MNSKKLYCTTTVYISTTFYVHAVYVLRVCSMCYKMDVYVIVLYDTYPNLSLFIHCLKSQGSVRLPRKYLTGLEVLTAMVMKICLLGCDTVSVGKWLLLF